MSALISRFRALTLISSLSVSLAVSLCLSLSGCGGAGSIGHAELGRVPAPVATSEFLSLVKDANCAEFKNRLLVIDQQYVLWDKSGNCADASYAQNLYGTSPSTLLCSHADSIAGPRTTCNDAGAESLFKTMILNLDKTDLGLGSSHQVQSIAIPGANNNSINFTVLPVSFYHGSAPDFSLIKDKQAWDAFWSVSGSKPATNIVAPDFNAEMILAKFYKTVNDCSIIRFLKVSSDGQKLHASFIDEERVSVTRCDLENTGISTPMQMIEMAKVDLTIELHHVNSALISHRSVASGVNSGIRTARGVVIRDQANWQQLWQEHQSGNGSGSSSSLPVVDFSKKMLIAVFLGTQASGCSGIQDLHIWRDAGKIVTTHYDVVAGPTRICTANITTPFYIAEVNLSSENVEFISVQALIP